MTSKFQVEGGDPMSEDTARQNMSLFKKLNISTTIQDATGKDVKIKAEQYPELLEQFVGADSESVETPAHWQEVYNFFKDKLTEYVRDDKNKIVKDDAGKNKERTLSLHEFISKYFVQGLNQKLSAEYKQKLIVKAGGWTALLNSQIADAMELQKLMPKEMQATEEEWRERYLKMFREKGLLPPS